MVSSAALRVPASRLVTFQSTTYYTIRFFGVSKNMTETLVSYNVADGIAVLMLNDPPANTYSYEMMQELDAAILQARFDPAVHVLVIRGSGDKFFCAGANIKMLQSVTPEYKYYF